MKRFGFGFALMAIVAHLLLGSVAYSESYSAGKASAKSTYDLMVSEFNEGNFEEAYNDALYIEQEGGSNYNDANLYINYLKGWNAVKQNEVDLAISYFKPLKDAGFEDSSGYYNYLMGRKQQELKKYEEAIAYYEEATREGVYEGITYQSECEIAMQEEKYAAGERYEQQGDYLSAAKVFEELDIYQDSNERCKSNYYNYANQLLQSGEYKNAKSIFDMLGDYQDSAHLASECWNKLQTADESIALDSFICDKATDSTLSIAWTDENDMAPYIVSYYPGKMENLVCSLRTTDCALVLENLLPATKYHCVIQSEMQGIDLAEHDFETLQANIQTNIRVKKLDLQTFRQRDLLDTAVDDLPDENKSSLLTNDVLVVSNTSMKNSGIGCLVNNYFNRAVTAEGELYTFRYVLRVGTDYVAMKEESRTIKNNLTNLDICTDITDLFDAIYEQAGSWVKGTASVDAYLDSGWIGQIRFIIDDTLE